MKSFPMVVALTALLVIVIAEATNRAAARFHREGTFITLGGIFLWLVVVLIAFIASNEESR